jgi:hypothetical protein
LYFSNRLGYSEKGKYNELKRATKHWENYSGSSMKQSKTNKQLAFNLPVLSSFPACYPSSLLASQLSSLK